ncbi:MAG: periplasmic heavy metal sensor [Deltaproteobacteria bacterium]|nr:periplasmic heavy metal sensor [Deltaproteobacteria bacterium]
MSTSEKGSSERSGASRWIRVGAVAGLAVVALFAGGALLPLGQASAGLFRHHGRHSPEEIRDRATFAVEWVLRSVDATDAQQDQVRAIVERTVNDLLPLREGNEDMREAALAALTGPTVNRQALEEIRTEKVAEWTDASEEIVASLAEIAEVLTPEQRQELAALADRWHH